MHDSANEMAVRAGPGIVVTTFQMVTNNLPNVILWATAIYSIAQAYLALRRVYHDWKSRRTSKKRRATDAAD